MKTHLFHPSSHLGARTSPSAFRPLPRLGGGTAKISVALLLVLWYFLMPQQGYAETGASSFPDHLLYILSHANIWHLCGNLFVWSMMGGRLYLIPSVAIAFLTSWLPAFYLWDNTPVTMGFSGVLFAIWGIKWGTYAAKQARSHNAPCRASRHSVTAQFTRKALPFALVGAVIPHVNWCLHLYCLIAGFLTGRTLWPRI